MSKVRFTVFSDLHHHPVWFKTDAPERLQVIQQRAVDDKSDFMIHLGDFCHDIKVARDLIDSYNNFQVKGFHVFGNHEFDLNSYQDALQAYNMSSNYYSFDHNGFRFIILDENYFRDFPGVYFHYSERNYFDHPAGRDYMPPEEIEWFRETVFSSPYPCIVFSHATMEYPGGGMKDYNVLQEIIRQSQSMPGRVMMCLNGHYHVDSFNVIDNVAYFAVNSASFYWIATPHMLYPAEWYKEIEGIGNQVTFTNALSATVTVDTNGLIDIAGASGEFLCGVSYEMTDNVPLRVPCTPSILDRQVRLEGF